jgi:hypothetical protein
VSQVIPTIANNGSMATTNLAHPEDRLQRTRSAMRYLTHPAVLRAGVVAVIWAYAVRKNFGWWWESRWQWWRAR